MGHIKLNVDGSYLSREERMGGGVVLRDSTSAWILGILLVNQVEIRW